MPVSNNVQILTKQELDEIKRDEWEKGYAEGLQIRYGSHGLSNTADPRLFGVRFARIRELIRNYELATGERLGEE
jgi:hypothetical protein